MTTGFIGLGTMGAPMARRLRSQGEELLCWDVDAAARSASDCEADSIDTIARECSCFITMLPVGDDVVQVQSQLLRAGVPAGSLFIDCSTIDVDTTRSASARLADLGHAFVDAPVSGGSEAAATGGLSFMVGGHAADIERARPLLEHMGKRISEFGPPGSGQAAKACHNMICGITAIGVCEAFALADALGLDLDRFHALCRNAAAQSWVLENRCPVPGPAPQAPASNNYAPGFAARLMAKDLALAQTAARAAGQPTPFGAEAALRFGEFADSGNGELDFSAIYRVIRGD